MWLGLSENFNLNLNLGSNLFQNMFSFTPHERKVIVFLAVLIFFGALLNLLGSKINNSKAIASIKNQPKESQSININTAGLDDLEKIPGIGPEIANRIIEYRKNNGNFISLDDLDKVKGIGAKKLGVIKKYIVFEEASPAPKE